MIWITLLALADRDGIAEASVPGLANYAGVTVDATEAALQKFLSPDTYSRTSDNEGRRIEKVDGGWRLLNHDKYRFKMSDDDRRERDRVRKQKYRDRQRESCPAECGTTRDTMGQDGQFREIQHTDSKEKEKEGGKKQSPARLTATTEIERLALRVIRSLDLVADRSLFDVISQSILVLSRIESLTVKRASEVLTERAKADAEFNFSEKPQRFWFADRKFLTQSQWKWTGHDT